MVVETITEAKAHFSALVERAIGGEEIVIKRAGKPVAVLRGYVAGESRRKPGAYRGRIEIKPDFDELPDDIAKALGAHDE